MHACGIKGVVLACVCVCALFIVASTRSRFFYLTTIASFCVKNRYISR